MAIEKRVASAEETNDLQSDNLAKDAGASWARGIKLKGDTRYRHELIDREGANQRNRQRLRVRLGLDAKVNDTVSAGLQLATGGDDPRSTNQTLGDGGPNVRLDVAEDTQCRFGCHYRRNRRNPLGLLDRLRGLDDRLVYPLRLV